MLVGCYYERQANDETNVRDSNKYKTIIVKNKFINTHTLRYLEMLCSVLLFDRSPHGVRAIVRTADLMMLDKTKSRGRTDSRPLSD